MGSSKQAIVNLFNEISPSERDALANFFSEIVLAKNDQVALVRQHGIQSADALLRLDATQLLDGVSKGGQRLLLQGLTCLKASKELTARSFKFGHLVAFLLPKDENPSSSELKRSGDRSPETAILVEGFDDEANNSTKRARWEDDFVHDTQVEAPASDEEGEAYQDNEKEGKLTESPSLQMILQRFNGSSTVGFDADRDQGFRFGEDDPDVVEYAGRSFSKYRCYELRRHTKQSLEVFKVGIRGFARGSRSSATFDSAFIVPVIHFSETILGDEKALPGDHADTEKDTIKDEKYIQLQVDQSNRISLSELGDACEEPNDLPQWIYEPMKAGSARNFGYIFDQRRVFGNNRVGRKQTLRVADMYCGAGGMHLGFKRAGYKIAVAVDRDKAAIQTLTTNLSESEKKDTIIVQSDVGEFVAKVKSNEELRNKIGPLDVGHFSTPCQAFSGANRFGGKNDEENRKQSFRFPDDVKDLNPRAAIFENVAGMWRRKNISYLFRIVRRLRHYGYSVRCSLLRACDYGDPQIRPRFFIIAVKKYIPMPEIPVAGYGDGKLPYVTCREAFQDIARCEQLGLPLFNHQKDRTRRQGDKDHPRLPANGLASTIRAGSAGRPVHFCEDRLVTVRETAASQSFPRDYQFCGNLTEQFRQVGNAVPVEMATAVAESLQKSLLWEYEQDIAGSEENNAGPEVKEGPNEDLGGSEDDESYKNNGLNAMSDDY